MSRRLIGLAATAVLATGALGGCASQIAGLAPVGGDTVSAVRIAAIDVLLEQKFGILEVPVCTQVATSVSCVGSLTDGAVISVQADVGSTPNTMTVTVGGSVVYDGEVQEVLDQAARSTTGVGGG